MIILIKVNISMLVDWIRTEMDRRLLTQTELARLANVSVQRVYNVLHGRSKSLKTIRAMRDALKDENASR